MWAGPSLVARILTPSRSTIITTSRARAVVESTSSETTAT
jgi:hypothetical protein